MNARARKERATLRERRRGWYRTNYWPLARNWVIGPISGYEMYLWAKYRAKYNSSDV